MRVTLFMLALAAAVAVGLWYVLAPSDTQVASEQPETTKPVSGTAPAAGDSQTTDAAPSTGAAQPADSGAASSSAGNLQTTGSGAAVPTGVAQTADSGAAAQGEEHGTADSGTAIPTSIAQTTNSGTAVPTGIAQTTDSGTTIPTGIAQTTGSGAAAAAGTARTAEIDTVAPTDAIQSTDSGATEATPQIAAAGEADRSGAQALVLSPAPEDTIEQVPVDAPPATDTAVETGLLAAVDRAIERIETVIREQLATEHEGDPGAPLRVQVTYDDLQGDATHPGGEPSEPASPTDSGTNPLSDAGQTSDSAATLPAGDAPTADSGVMASANIAQSADSDGTPPPEVTRTADSDSDAAEAEAEAEAKEYVEALIETAPQTIPVDKADHFVTQEHMLSLVPEDTIESVSVDELAKDKTLGAETPITIVREVEHIEIAVPERLIAESGGDLDTQLRVLVKYDDTEGVTEPSVTDQDDAESSLSAQGDAEPGNAGQTVAQRDTVEQITVREALERILEEPEKPITLIKTVRHFEVVTLRELLDTEVDTGTFLNVVRRPYRIEAATLADLLQRKKTENPDTIFYLHTVQHTDEQGIWGIVHYGLIDNFARGVALKRGEKMETYTVQIPRDADERLDDQSSSFLGRLIDYKTKDSFVYNYRDNRMGRNPDRIYPGQEIVIINFEPEELTAIYTHFASR